MLIRSSKEKLMRVLAWLVCARRDNPPSAKTIVGCLNAILILCASERNGISSQREVIQSDVCSCLLSIVDWMRVDAEFDKKYPHCRTIIAKGLSECIIGAAARISSSSASTSTFGTILGFFLGNTNSGLRNAAVASLRTICSAAVSEGCSDGTCRNLFSGMSSAWHQAFAFGDRHHTFGLDSRAVLSTEPRPSSALSPELAKASIESLCLDIETMLRNMILSFDLVATDIAYAPWVHFVLPLLKNSASLLAAYQRIWAWDADDAEAGTIGDTASALKLF